MLEFLLILALLGFGITCAVVLVAGVLAVAAAFQYFTRRN